MNNCPPQLEFHIKMKVKRYIDGFVGKESRKRMNREEQTGNKRERKTSMSDEELPTHIKNTHMKKKVKRYMDGFLGNESRKGMNREEQAGNEQERMKGTREE